MKLRIISVLFAALLLAGTAASAVQPTDDGRITAQSPAEAGTPAANAQDIALAHAGLTDQEVTGLKTEPDLEDGILEMDVQFRQGDWEYEYEILAEDGTIVSWDKEYEPEAPKAAAPAVEPVQSAAISAEEASAIALAHAGLGADQVSGLKVEKDYDDGRWEYDVEFRQGDWEYEYELLAEDGSILIWNKEYDPEAPKAAAPAVEPVQSAAISAEEASAIALAHAGLGADQVSGLKVEKDYDDGRWEYDVEFRQGQWEYEYELLAEDGSILSWEKEIDD